MSIHAIYSILLIISLYYQFIIAQEKNGEGEGEGEGGGWRFYPWEIHQLGWWLNYMLDWYIEYKKEQHAGFIWKTQHHLKCADVLNREFAMGVTSTQVTCHYRHYKENWQIVERALNNSGNGFDASKCKLAISESEKAKLRGSILHLKSSHYCH